MWFLCGRLRAGMCGLQAQKKNGCVARAGVSCVPRAQSTDVCSRRAQFTHFANRECSSPCAPACPDMIAPPSEDPLMVLPAAETQPQNEQPLASAALQASADDIKLVNEMFVNQTVTIDLLQRELKARELRVSAKNKDTLVARLATAIRSAGPDGNVQQCSTVVATKTKLSKRKVDTDPGAAKRQQLAPAEQARRHDTPTPATGILYQQQQPAPPDNVDKILGAGAGMQNSVAHLATQNMAQIMLLLQNQPSPASWIGPVAGIMNNSVTEISNVAVATVSAAAVAARAASYLPAF